MRQPWRLAWHRSRSFAIILMAVLSPLAALLPAIAGGVDSAAAATADGYTASRIPTGLESVFVAVDSVTGTVYLADATDRITVVNGATNTVTAAIALPTAPRGIAVDPVTDTVYVSLNTSPPTVDVIDGATNQVTATITLAAGSLPSGITVDSSTDTVYVAESSAAAVAVIDGSTNAVTATVSTGSGTRPYQLAVDETTGDVWVANLSGSVLAISGNAVTETVSLSGADVLSVAVNPVSDTVYAAERNNDVAVIDGAAGTLSVTIALQAATSTFLYGVAVDPGAGTVFASGFAGTNTQGTTWVIDGSNNTVADTIPRGGVGITVNTATGSAYVAPDAAQTNAAWVLTPATVNAWSPVIASTSATFDTGAVNSFTVTGSALPAATYSESGQLPSGVTFSPSGILFGTPAAGAAGSYPITLTASNGIAPNDSETFTLTVVELPSVTASSSATFRVGQPGTVPLLVTGNPPVTNLSFYDPAPSWLQLIFTASGQWELTGTPPVGSGGVYDLVINAESSGGATLNTIPVTVQEAPTITSAPTTTFLADSSHLYYLSASGYPAPTFTVTGSLPQGVALLGGDQLVEEPPLGIGQIGTYHFTINATNNLGTASQAFTLIVRSPVAVGAEGSDGRMWVQAPQLPGGWRPMGGQITAPPAVAAQPDFTGRPVAPLFIATGTNKHLYLRSLTTGWRELGPVGGSCIGGPAAVITGTPSSGPFTLTVACRSTDNALWENSATLPASGLPQFTAKWTRLGGVLSAAPAIAPVGGALTFFVRGTNGRIYTRTLTTGFSAKPWSCIGSPAAATNAVSGITTLAFQGTDHALWEATNSGSGWTQPGDLGGSLIGGPAVAANGDEPYLLAEGTNHAVWQRAPSVGWSTLGGIAVGGVGAANLTS